MGKGGQILPSDDPKWPIYGDLLTLPLAIEPADLVPITWNEGKASFTKNYYQMRAWFNRPPSMKDPKPADYDAQYEKAKECVIFVAEEFIHPRYRHGPPMANQHLLNVPTRVRLDANGEGKIQTLDEALKNAYASTAWDLGWARLTIDEEFYYGQAEDPNKRDRRWIVYHPRREAYQGRFVVDKKQQWLETIAAQLPTITIAGINIVSMDASKAQAFSKLCARMAGDPLRQFVSPDALKLLDPGTTKKDTGLVDKEKESTLVIPKPK